MSVPKNPVKGIKGTGNRKDLGPGTSVLVVELLGANVIAEHLWAIGQYTESFAPGILDVVSDIVIEVARDFVPSPFGYPNQGMGRNPGGYPNFGKYATGETWESINKRPGVISKSSRGEWSVRIGPTTPQARLLEYGTLSMSPRPFMIMGGDAGEIVLMKSVLEFVKLVGFTGRTGFGGSGTATGQVGQALSDPRITNPLTAVRTMLYSSSKFLGDLSVFGGRGMFGPARSAMNHMARGLGDLSAVMNMTIGTRVTNRLTGRATGRISGFGSSTLNFSKSYSGFAGGSAGHRIYQRVVGKATQGQFSIGGGSLRNLLP